MEGGLRKKHRLKILMSRACELNLKQNLCADKPEGREILFPQRRKTLFLLTTVLQLINPRMHQNTRHHNWQPHRHQNPVRKNQPNVILLGSNGWCNNDNHTPQCTGSCLKFANKVESLRSLLPFSFLSLSHLLWAGNVS